MALAHDPSTIASAVSIAAGDMLFLPAADRVDGVALWTSDGTQAGTRRIGPLRTPGDDDSHGRPDTGERSLSGGTVNGQRLLSSILDDWRDAERRLETAHQADDAAEVTRLGAEVTAFADEHRDAFESVLAQYAEGERMPHARSSVAWSTPKES